VTEVRVPDIGDFTDVPVIEILVGPGDRIAVDDPLVTLESDKATIDIPAPSAGVVSQLQVKQRPPPAPPSLGTDARPRSTASRSARAWPRPAIEGARDASAPGLGNPFA